MSEAELYAAIRDFCDDLRAFAYQHSTQRDQTYRELAHLATEKGPPERVQYQWLPLLREGLVDFHDFEDALRFRLDDPLEDLEPKESPVVEAVLREFHARYRINLREDPLALRRIVDEALDVAEALDETGAAELRLPYLGAKPDGPCHFCVRLKRSGGAIEVAEYLPHVPKPKVFKPRPPDPEERLLDLVIARFKSDKGVDLRVDDAAMRRLRMAATAACKELQSSPRAFIDLPWITSELIEPTHLKFSVSREMLGAALVIAPKVIEPRPVSAKKESKLANVLRWVITLLVIAIVMWVMYLLDL